MWCNTLRYMMFAGTLRLGCLTVSDITSSLTMLSEQNTTITKFDRLMSLKLNTGDIKLILIKKIFQDWARRTYPNFFIWLTTLKCMATNSTFLQTWQCLKIEDQQTSHASSATKIRFSFSLNGWTDAFCWYEIADIWGQSVPVTPELEGEVHTLFVWIIG